MTSHLISDNACFISHNSHKRLALIKDNCEILCYTWSGLIHFACIGVSHAWLDTPRDRSRGSNSNAGKMYQTWSSAAPWVYLTTVANLILKLWQLWNILRYYWLFQLCSFILNFYGWIVEARQRENFVSCLISEPTTQLMVANVLCACICLVRKDFSYTCRKSIVSKRSFLVRCAIRVMW